MATLGAYQKKHKVAIVGSGNWYVISSLPKDDQAWKQGCRKAQCFWKALCPATSTLQ